jgi:hypothetical protein
MRIRITRKLAACIGLSAMLFAQLAVSAYACPAISAAVESAQAAHTPPCHGSVSNDSDQPALCQAHCQDGQQNVNDLQPFALAAFVPAFIVTIIDSAAQMLEQVRPASPSLLHSTSPPLSIRNCCFRI